MKKQEILIYLQKRERETWSNLLSAEEEGNIAKAKKLRVEWCLLFKILMDLGYTFIKIDNPTDDE